MAKVFKENLIAAQEESHDDRSKFLLSIKVVVAQIFNFLVKVYKKFDVNEIADKFLTDPNQPSDFLVKTLNPALREPNDIHTVRDLVFNAKIPTTQQLIGEKYQQFYVNFESQKTDPSDYNIVARALIYGCLTFGNQNHLLKHKAVDQYRNLEPELAFWFEFGLDIEESRTEIFYLINGKDGETFFSSKEEQDDSVESMLTIYFVQIGQNLDLQEKNIYTFLWKLLMSKEPNAIIDLFNEYNFKYDKEELDMMLSGIELSGIEKGKAEGLAEGKAETLKKYLKNLENYLKKTNKDLSDKDIHNLAIKMLDIKEDPKEV